MPKLHKCPYKQPCITGLLIIFLCKAYFYTFNFYSCSYQNGFPEVSYHQFIQRWGQLNTDITKQNSAFKSFEYTTLYTTISHTQLKLRLHSRIDTACYMKDGAVRYQYLDCPFLVSSNVYFLL